MDEIKDMLRAVINGQHAFKSEVKKELHDLLQEINDRFDDVDKRFDEVNERLDKQGKHLAYLEYDAPTREEYNTLTKKVEKIEQTLSH